MIPSRTPRTAGLTLLVPLMLAALAGPLSARTARSSRVHRTRSDAVDGLVVDARGDAIAGATVQVVELGIAVASDTDGRFTLPDVPAGRWTVTVSHPGHRARAVEIDVPAAARIRVELEVDPIPIDPVTVSVTRRPLDPSSSPLPVASVGREDLDRRQSISLARTLERLAGVRTLSTGREIGKPVIRGSTGARVVVLSEGMRLEDYAWSDEDAPSIDAAMADRVEVVRGPGSVLFGPGAVGGVVNVIPRALPRASNGASILRGSVDFSTATNNHEADLILRGEGAAGGWSGRLVLAGRKAEALHTPEGELENTGFEALNGEAVIERHGGWGTFTARYLRYGGEFRLLEEDGPPVGEGEEPPLEEGPERKLADDRVVLAGNFPIGGLRLETKAQLQRHHLIELEDDPEALAKGRFVEVEIYDLTLDTGSAEVLLHHELGDGISGTVGLSGRVQTSTGAGLLQLIPDASMRGGGVFALERVERGRWTFLAGARADLEQIDADDQPTRSFSSTTFSGGAVFRPAEGLALSANVGRAWRAPTLFELFADGPRLGEGRYEIGRADLDPESAINLDVGMRWSAGRLRGEVSGFRNTFDGYLFIQPTAQVRDGYQVFRYAQADATVSGLEASVELEATPFLSLGATGETLTGTNDTRDEPLPLMAPARVRFEAELHSTGATGVRRWLGAEVEHVAEQGDPNPNDLVTDAYTLVHAVAGIEGRWAGRDLRVDLTVRNLFDEAYRDFLSRYKSFALDPGRDVILRLRMGL